MYRVILLSTSIFVVIFAEDSSALDTNYIDSIDIAIKNCQIVRGVVKNRR